MPRERGAIRRWNVAATVGAFLLATAWIGFAHVVLAVSIALQAVFIAFFVRHLAFAISAMRDAPTDLRIGVGAPDETQPSVTVLVACLNEASVVRGLVERLSAIDYPRDRLEVVIVDDGSTDGTGVALDEAVAAIPGFRCVHRRPGAGGGKSGALNEALTFASGEIVIVFDADHRPRPDVVRRLVRHFRDPLVAAVQGRCVIRNRDDSLLSQLVWLDYLAGYLVNEYGRQSLFQLPAYGGANCAVRMTALRAVGAWNERTVTEDTDLTLRLVLSGHRVRYDVTAVDEEEGVVTLGRFWRQRYRWARGHQQVWRDYRRAVLRSGVLSAWDKAELMMFLFVFHLPVLSGLGLVIFAMWITGLTDPFGDTHTFVFWTLLFLGPLLELGSGLLIAGAPRHAARLLLFFLPIFFISIGLCAKAWIDGVKGRAYTWEKTERSSETLQVVS